MKNKKAVVIGAGFGGIAAAIRMQARGYETTLLEMLDKPGGLAYVYEQDGFTFDSGPTIITAPFLIDELFALAGKKTEDYVKIVPCDPFYRIVFHDGSHIDYSGDKARMMEQYRRVNPADAENYEPFMEKSKRIFERGFIDLADYPFSTFWDMVRTAPDLIRLGAYQSVYQFASSYFKDPRMRFNYSFHPLFVGGNPFKASSIYGMIHYLEREWGVHFAMGGTGALVQGFVRLFEEMGGTLHLNTKVEEVLIENQKVQGVRTESGATYEADVVIANSGVVNTYRRMVPKKVRHKWTDGRLERMRHSMSLFLIYFGTKKQYPELPHHTIMLTRRYRGLINDIFEKKILADDFSLYLHAPTRTDPSLAPEGGECFYVLSPVPNLAGDIDWDKEKDAYADKILASVEERLCPGLRENIVTRKVVTPVDFQTRYDMYLGAPFQFEPVLTQSAWFRPHNVSEDVEGLYLCGAGTHPGAGLPGVLCSAKLLERVIPLPTISSHL